LHTLLFLRQTEGTKTTTASASVSTPGLWFNAKLAALLGVLSDRRVHGCSRQAENFVWHLEKNPNSAWPCATEDYACTDFMFSSEHRSIGASEHRSIEASKHRSIEASKHRSIEASKHQSIKASKHQSIKASKHQRIKASQYFNGLTL
jgi:hypothetical protein